ncbi:hypothetical protein B0H13DRAFT_2661307 [Mycena leptocephala]|nr:hypothetical protein B0H13DRAFT_2661307 [Mycena leptocephala]
MRHGVTNVLSSRHHQGSQRHSQLKPFKLRPKSVLPKQFEIYVTTSSMVETSPPCAHSELPPESPIEEEKPEPCVEPVTELPMEDEKYEEVARTGLGKEAQTRPIPPPPDAAGDEDALGGREVLSLAEADGVRSGSKWCTQRRRRRSAPHAFALEDEDGPSGHLALSLVGGDTRDDTYMRFHTTSSSCASLHSPAKSPSPAHLDRRPVIRERECVGHERKRYSSGVIAIAIARIPGGGHSIAVPTRSFLLHLLMLIRIFAGENQGRNHAVQEIKHNAHCGVPSPTSRTHRNEARARAHAKVGTGSYWDWGDDNAREGRDRHSGHTPGAELANAPSGRKQR